MISLLEISKIKILTLIVFDEIEGKTYFAALKRYMIGLRIIRWLEFRMQMECIGCDIQNF